MAVHTVEPRDNPAAAWLQKADAKLRMPLTGAAPDHSEADQHHLHRMGDDVLGAETLEAIDANLGHAGSGPFVKADREIEILGCGPERLVIGVVDHLVVVGVGPQKTALEAHSFFANRISAIARSISCIGSIATLNSRSG